MAARRTQKSEQAPATPKYLGVFVTENFQGNDGEERTSYTRVGGAFPHKKGCGFNSRSPKVSRSADCSSRFPRVRARRARPAGPARPGDWVLGRFAMSYGRKWCTGDLSCAACLC